MERESASLAREFKAAEQTYGADHLDLVLAKGYVSKLKRPRGRLTRKTLSGAIVRISEDHRE
jgi:hypothetical protein